MGNNVALRVTDGVLSLRVSSWISFLKEDHKEMEERTCRIQKLITTQRQDPKIYLPLLCHFYHER